MVNLDDLRWVLYAGDRYTPVYLMGNPSKYFNNQDKIIGGMAISLKGDALKAYKQAYKDQHRETIKGSKLVVIDRVRARAFLDYCYPSSPLSWTQRSEGAQQLSLQSATSTTSPLSQIVSSPVQHAPLESSLGKATHCSDPKNSILDELVAITAEKNLHWVSYEDKMYLVMVEASLAKGMEKDDYSSNWYGKLPGEARLLDGATLQSFKSAYISTYNTWPYPRARSIRIGDWEHVYSYLVQGKSTTANTFQSMGAKSIERQALIEAPACPSTWTSEEDLVDRVFSLMELSTIKMQRELCIVNTLQRAPTTRRLDAIEYINTDSTQKVHVYEFKKGAISVADITNTIAVKGYLHIVRELYPTSKVGLFLVGNGIEPQAQLLLEAMHGVMYLPLSTLLNRILQDIVSSWPREGQYQLKTHFLSQYQDILPPAMLKGPIPHQPILTTYHKPMAGHCR